MCKKRNEVILFFGPPHVGKSLHYKQHLQCTHQRISASELYLQHKNFGLHNIIMQVVDLLLQNKNVVIDDENWSASLRQSYIKGIKKKVINCIFTVVIFTPKLGKHQLLWMREFALAHMSLNSHNDYDVLDSDEKISHWFSNSSALEYPSAIECCNIVKVQTKLKCESYFKFEVPVLFLQWKGLCKDSELNHDVEGLINKWYQLNSAGRIIILNDDKEKESEVKKIMKYTLTELCLKLDHCPVYFVYIKNHIQSGKFSEAPNPGILAWLQRLHHLDFSAKSSIFLVSDNIHVQMAKNAGLRFAKLNTVLSRSHMLFSTKFNIPPEPYITESIELVLLPTSNSNPLLPLFDNITKSDLSFLWLDAGFGRIHGLCVKNLDILKKYQRLYSENATSIRTQDSIVKHLENEDCINENVTDFDQSRKKRQLPQWMHALPSENKTPKMIKRSCSSRTTVYVMSEKELLEEAHVVLKENCQSSNHNSSVNHKEHFSPNKIHEETSIQNLINLETSANNNPSAICDELIKSNTLSEQTTLLLEPLFLNENKRPPPKKRLKQCFVGSERRTDEIMEPCNFTSSFKKVIPNIFLQSENKQEDTLLINSSNSLCSTSKVSPLLKNGKQSIQKTISCGGLLCLPDTELLPSLTPLQSESCKSNFAKQTLKSKADFSFLDTFL